MPLGVVGILKKIVLSREQTINIYRESSIQYLLFFFLFSRIVVNPVISLEFVLPSRCRVLLLGKRFEKMTHQYIIKMHYPIFAV